MQCLYIETRGNVQLLLCGDLGVFKFHPHALFSLLIFLRAWLSSFC